MKKSYQIISLVFFAAFSLQLMAQKPMEKRAFEISLEADEAIQTEIKNNKRINLATGQAVALYALNFEVPNGTPESMAQFYLQKEHQALGISKAELSNLQHHATRTTNAGSVVRYRQHINGIPVNKAEVTITISPQNKVVMVLNSFQQIKTIDTQPTVTAEQAYQLAYNYLNVTGNLMHTDNRLMIYSNAKMARLAHEVVISTNTPRGEWHVFVDAKTQEIFKVVDMNYYYSEDNDHEHHANCKHNQPVKYGPYTVEEVRRRATGTAMVFNPDPLTSNVATYGDMGYVDGSDADTAQLTAARFAVNLNDITLTGSTYSLVGPRAEIVDFDTPSTGLFSQNSSDFSFTRNEQGFEPANTYYHIDFLMDYINNTLGCNVLPYQYSGGVQFDPHGNQGADNSFYTSGAGRLSFGEGCVDDAEDSDVIHHELGHGLHDWVTSGGLSQVDGLSEGSGDYVAQSYNRSLGYLAPTDAAYNYVFRWDGHNECWPGRDTDYFPGYPGGLTGSIHTDGQIWSSCLMTVWDEIGQQRMDKIFYEGLGMTNGNSSQDDAANAVYQAAINLNYTQTELNAIHTNLSACGYTLPALPGPPVAAFSANTENICLDNINTVIFTDETEPAATSWSWTFEGGTPATSTDQNPTVTYAADGTYDVTLQATNSYGSDTITLTDYITVVSGAACPACTTTTQDTDVNLPAPGTYTSIINIPTGGTITDVNVTIDITHTWDADLDISIISPTGTIVELTSDNGSLGDNYENTVFDMDGVDGPITDGTAPFTGTYIPEGDLSDFNSEDAAGDWVLEVIDDAAGDVGVLNFWKLELCIESPTASVDENAFDAFSIYPNPNNGTFTVKLNSFSNQDINIEVYDIRGRYIFNNSYTNTTDFSETINLNNAQAGVYLVKINDGDKQVVKRIVVE